MEDMWRSIPGYSGAYEVNNKGTVRRVGKDSPKKPTMHSNGYYVVTLWKSNKSETFYVHDIVSMAFLGPKPNGLCVNHINGKKADNFVDNLEYVTLAENTLHACRMGLQPRGEKNGHSKLTDGQVIEIRRRIALGESGKSLAAEFNISKAAISQIKSRTRWRHLS